MKYCNRQVDTLDEWHHETDCSPSRLRELPTLLSLVVHGKNSCGSMARAPRAKRRRETGAKVIARRYERVAGGGERAGHIISSATTDCRRATSYQIVFTATSLPSGLEKSGQPFSHTILTVQ
jgi:hypothetical protein